MAEIAIRAAGGVVVKDGQVLLVHRPRHDDWSLPKGKLKRGEHPLAAAVREVWEETGVTGRPGRRLPTAHYDVWSGDALTPKVVDYWAMAVGNVEVFRSSNEVDEITWLPATAALERLSYDHDRLVVAALDGPTSPPVLLLRHAHAQDRRSWPGPDTARPLDADGERQAVALAELIPLFGPDRLVSAQPLRCTQTLAGAAGVLGLTVQVDARLSEGADPGTTALALRELARGRSAAVVCSQGDVIASTVALLSGRPDSEHVVDPGDGLVLSFAHDALIAVDRFALAVD